MSLAMQKPTNNKFKPRMDDDNDALVEDRALIIGKVCIDGKEVKEFTSFEVKTSQGLLLQ